MGLESATHIDDLVTTNPVSTDQTSQGDDHLRLLKSVLKTTFPSAAKPFRFPNVVAVSADATAAATDDNEAWFVDCTSEEIDITLPTLTSGQAGWSMKFIKADAGANAIEVLPPSGTINGKTSIKVKKQYECLEIVWTGTVFLSALIPLPFPYRIVAKTGDATLTDDEMRSVVLVDPSSGTATITLPTAVDKDGDWVLIRRQHASNNVIIEGHSSETIDGATAFSFSTQNEAILLVAGDDVWYIAMHFSGVTSAPPQGIPQGYLTLSETSGSPILTGDMTAKTAVYYDFLNGDQIPISTDGVSFRMRPFTRSTLTLVASHAAGNIYDVYMWDEDGVLTIGTSPAWSSSTAGSSSRGTGAGTAEIARVKGLYTNANSMTMRNGNTTYTVDANKATLLGTIYMDGTNGQISCHRTIGQSRKWGVVNLYNKKEIILKVTESTSTWTYQSATLRPSNNATANSISVLQCLPEEQIEVQFEQFNQVIANSQSTQIAVGWNSTNTASGKTGQFTNNNSAAVTASLFAHHINVPALGLNLTTALESSTAAAAPTFNGGEEDMLFTARFFG